MEADACHASADQEFRPMTKTFLLGATSLITLLVATPATAQYAGHQGHVMPTPAPAPEPAKPAATTPDPHAGHDMPAPPAADPHAGHDMTAMDHGDHGAMTGALGSYPAGRESSGTAWQPDSATHRGLMTQAGDWHLMAHADLFAVYSNQGSRRGDDKWFGAGMIMGMAQRPVGGGTLQLRAGFSPDPLMGKSGYPLLLASGETADGVNRLIDRQHPHDFVMELSASLSQPIGPKSSVFLYGGLPGEPAFGPGAFMHRESIMDSPEAPISHHWLDSQHISFGVLTGGVVLDRFKVEVSRFNGREPDERRWNIETGPLDSTAVRISFNPTRDLALQASWASLKEPEQLEPGVNQKRWSASAIYAIDLASGWRSASTLARGRKSAEGHDYDAFVAESSLKKGLWTLFARGEITENSELLPIDHDDEEHHGEAFRVGKVSAGAIRDFAIAPQLKLGIGGLLSVNFVPEGLRAEYGKARPLGGMAFVRLKVG
jgi:hypothetical protein